MVEVDREADLEAVERLEARPLVAVADGDRLLDADEALGLGLVFYAGRLQQEYERPGAAVHDRHFRRRQVDIGVVDAESGHRREQMLDRRDADIAFDERGGKASIAYVFASGADFHRDRHVDPAEHDAGVNCCRSQGHVDLVARVKTHARRSNDVFERALSDHFYGLTPGAGADKTSARLAQRVCGEKLNDVWIPQCVAFPQHLM